MRLLLDLIQPTAGLGDAARARQPRATASRSGAGSASCPATSRSTRSSPARRCSTTSPSCAAASTGGVRDAARRALRRPPRPPVRELSTGNRQKLGLIQAFMHEPELLILDEPIAGLDPLVQQSFHALLGEVAAQGRTVFLSSHTLSRGRAGRRPRRDPAPRVGWSSSTRSRTCARSPSSGSRSSSPATRREPRSSARCPACARSTLDGAHLIVAFEGSADPLVKAVAAHEVRSIRSRDDDLEEIFLRYYRDASERERADLRAGAAPARCVSTALDGARAWSLVILMVGALLPGRRRLDRQARPARRASPTCSAAPTTARSPAGCAARSARSTARS